MFDSLPPRPRAITQSRTSWEKPVTPVSESHEIPPGATADRGSTLLLGGSVRILELESFRDERGVLTPITFDDFGFSAARAFVVRAPEGSVRGGHGHRRVRQVLFCASGAIEVEVRHGGTDARLMLDERHPAALLEAGVWAQQTYVGADSTLIVFADGPYDSAEYDDDRSADEAVS
jgi:dTDP-4-dehydrorhamnose 3,5-epimerase-like enzyme